jgi:glucose/arabinose dehydrogenase
VYTTPRLLRLEGGRGSTVLEGENPPWTGVTFRQGRFYITEGGKAKGGRVVEWEGGRLRRVLLQGLPSYGDHHTNDAVLGPDGALYVGQGTPTNSGVVGPDNAEFGWLAQHPSLHDVPCRDVTLAGVNYDSEDPRSGAPVSTGAYVPYGTPTAPGQIVPGVFPCSGAVYRLPLAEGDGAPELYAWGFRNPYGLAFDGEGHLLVTENGADDRGSRPVWGSGDYLWRVERGAWHGWPDYAGGRPLTGEQFGPPGGEPPRRLLRDDPGPVPQPLAYFGVHSSSNGVDVARGDAFGYTGQAFVAQFGDMAPQVGKVISPVGFKVVRVDLARGTVADFAANVGRSNGPASLLGTTGLERPVSVRFSPAGDALYIVDFGIVSMTDEGPRPQAGTGRVLRVLRTGGAS